MPSPGRFVKIRSPLKELTAVELRTTKAALAVVLGLGQDAVSGASPIRARARELEMHEGHPWHPFVRRRLPVRPTIKETWLTADHPIRAARPRDC